MFRILIYSILVVALLSLGLTACQAVVTPTQELQPTAVPSTMTPQGPTYTNPVYPHDFPDPHILLVDDIYYAYATNGANVNIQVIRSTDLVNWERLGDALPALPEWAAVNQGLTWAPGVTRIGDTFILYYTARYEEIGLQCVSRALSDQPEGPFFDDTSEPFVCQNELGGSIDPYPFWDNGKLYLLWKNDGNCCGKEVGLWVQTLADDGLSLTGEPVELIRRDQAWERPLIENPAMVKNGSKYYLFYSGNWWEGHEYAVGYAVCETITGPCEKPLTEPLFHFTPEVMGPGGESFFVDTEGQLWMAYHGWTGPYVGYPSGQRSLRIEPVTFIDGTPFIDGPTHQPQPLP